MKITGDTLKELINEELKSDEALLKAIKNLADKIEDLDISVDFLSAAFVGGDPLSIGHAQKSIGRAYRPSMRRSHEPLQHEHTKITEAILKELIREELTKTDKADIKTLISKELDKTLKKEVKKVLEDELSKALNSKANKEEIAEITKKVMKKLYKDLSYHHPYIIDRIKV